MTTPHYRYLNITSNETCAIPRELDKLYCKLKEEDKLTSSLTTECSSKEEPLKILYNSNLTDSDFNNNVKFCLRSLGMRTWGYNESDSCLKTKNCLFFEQCYCNDKDQNIEENATIQCLCELKTYGDNCYGSRNRIIDYYARKNCTINGLKEKRLPNITSCSLHTNPYSFEDLYFLNTSCPEEREPMFAKISHAHALKAQYNLPVVLLIVYIFTYILFFGKENEFYGKGMKKPKNYKA